MIVFFDNLPPKGPIALTAEQCRHLKAKRIAQDGIAITLSDGKHIAHASLSQSSKGFIASYSERLVAPARSNGLTLFAAIIKPDRMSWLIEKAVEIGVNKIVPIYTERSQGGYWSPSTQAHLEKIVLSACIQSFQLTPPILCPPISLESSILNDVNTLKFYGSLAKTSSKLGNSSLIGQDISLWIGPEGGWSDSEEIFLEQQATPIFYPGPVLRAETAALVLGSMLANQINQSQNNS